MSKQPTEISSDQRATTNWTIIAIIVLGTFVALLPLILHLPAPTSPRLGQIFAYLPTIVALVLCYKFDQKSAKHEKIGTLLLCLVLAFTVNYLHYSWVDRGQYFRGTSNLDWQLGMHQAVLDLRPDNPPHSYRFLPNSFVRLFEQVTGDFAIARDSYRNVFGLLFFYAYYRFARLFLRHGGSLFCLALMAVIMPVSFRYYAGQLTDPMSHLSFVLAFLFLETQQFAYLVLAVTIGCLAKETIAAMAGYYVLFRWREHSYITKSALIAFSTLAVCLLARMWVLHGVPAYQQISGTGFDQARRNLGNYFEWIPGFIYTAGIFIPFAIAGWKKSPWALRSLAAYWLPVLLFSGLFFSWLRESRNFVPLAMILAVLTVYYLVPYEQADSMTEREPAQPTRPAGVPQRKLKRGKTR